MPTLKPQKQSTRGYDITFQMPADVESFDELNGPGAALAHANAEVIYRFALPTLWRKVMEDAPEVFGVPVTVTGQRENKRNPEAGPVDVFEGIDTYLPKLKKAVEESSRSTELTAFIQNIANGIEPVVERRARSKKAAPVFYDKAKELAEKIVRGEGSWERTKDLLATRGIVASFTISEDGKVDMDQLALDVQSFYTADTGLV